MTFLKLFFNSLASVCLVFQTSFAYAGTSITQAHVDNFNYWNQPENLEKLLKSKFKTKEDHRLISQEFSKVKESSKKWIWRFEKQGEKFIFRINGKVQGQTQLSPNDKDTVVINGVKIKITPGMSFASYLKKASLAMSQKQASYDALFFNEAQALNIFAVFIAAAYFGLAASLGGSKASASTPAVYSGGGEVFSTPYSSNCNPMSKRYEGYNGRLNGYRVGQTARNFTLACGPDNISCHNFDSVDDCVRFKKIDPRNRAWGASHNDIVGLCNHAYNQVAQCTQAVPVAVAVDPILGNVVGETCPKTQCHLIEKKCSEGNQACCNDLQTKCGAADPMQQVVGQTCPKTTPAGQRNACNNCSGNKACCVEAGIQCGQGGFLERTTEAISPSEI